MSETPRSQGTVGDAGAWPPQLRDGRAFAHAPGASRSGIPHRSDRRPPQTPRGARHTDQDGRLGTIPPVPGRPYALPLLLGLCALAFALLTWQVVSEGPLLRADERLSGALAGRQPRGAAEFFADLGNMEVALPVLLLFLGAAAWHARRADRRRRWLPPLAALAAFAAVPLLVVPLKALVDRPGPPGANPGGYYPSGHTATATVVYGICALLLLPLLRRAARRIVIALCVLINLGVGCGLVLRGYHWPLDVAGSWLLCLPLLAGYGGLTARWGR